MGGRLAMTPTTCGQSGGHRHRVTGSEVREQGKRRKDRVFPRDRQKLAAPSFYTFPSGISQHDGSLGL